MLLLLTAAVLLTTGCTSEQKPRFSDEERDQAEQMAKALHTTDSLHWLVLNSLSDGNLLGHAVALRVLGQCFREVNQFADAIQTHLQALNAAESIGDTIEMVSDINNLGTDYRRVGSLTEASAYHLQALELSKSMSDQTSQRARKNRVVSLNGLGNVFLSMNNFERADSVLRLALEGERELGSLLGQAINMANLGAIKDKQGQTDSAWHYYRESMRLNEQCQSTVGMALCHTHFGELYEHAGQYEEALAEYQEAHDLMAQSHDDWHRLNAQLNMVRVYISMGKTAQARTLLEKSQDAAIRIGSLEHRAEAHRLFYELYKQAGDTRSALANHEVYWQLSDSLLDMQKLSEIQNQIVALERGQRQSELTLAQENLQLERSSKRVALLALIAIALLAVAAIAFLWYHLRTRTRQQRIVQQVQKTRETFFTNITHEFRTPLTVILGLGHQLEDMKAEDMGQVRSAAKMIVRQGNSLLSLINQLLDISKVRSAVGEPKWRRGNIVAYVNMVVDNFQPYAQSKCQELSYSHSLSQIETDFVPDYVDRIVSNLLSNAIKYTPQYGKIDLTLEKMSGGRLKMQVFDTGRGISAKVLPRVFEAFVQGEQTVGDVGTGVGLSLVKLMTEAMNGQVAVESTEGEGSTFTVILPLRHKGNTQPIGSMTARSQPSEVMDNLDTPPDDEPQGEASTAEPTVLIVEDNQDIAYYIGMHLQGYRLLYARGATEGLQKVQEKVPDLIITDLMMPGNMDGLELCRQVRQNNATNHIPIIIVTAKTNEQDRVEGLEAGADAYLVKPFSSEELLVRVRKLVEQRRMMRNKYGPDTNDTLPSTRQQLSQKERLFMNQLTDAVHALMPQGKADVESVAQRMDLTRGQLNRRMLAITNQNSQTYIMRLRLTYAKRLLRGELSMPIGDVAQRCGFDDMAYFSRIFKQQTGMTPSQYRRSE